jgi:hypothetical protein
MMNRVAACVAAIVLSAGAAIGAENSLMHCFAFTPIETASQAEWDAFYKATSALPDKIPGLKRVWAGKLARPLTVGQAKRANGVCMEFEDQKAYQAYGPHAEHKNWVSVYEKVRVAGTTTFQILPQ